MNPASVRSAEPNLWESVRMAHDVDDTPLKYRVWESPGPCRAVLVLLNGIMSHSVWFSELATRLAPLGFRVIGADRRGSGLNAPLNEAHSRRQLLNDVYTTVEQERRDLPVFVLGWCWGAVLAMNFAIEYHTFCDGLVLLAPGLFPSGAVRSAASAELDRIKRSSGETELLRSPITEEMFTDGPRLNDFILADELRSRHLTLPFYDLMLRMSFIAALRMPNLTRPILLLLADRDQAVDNQRTMQAFKKSLAHLSCETLDCNHGMQFEMPDEVASRIAKWVQDTYKMPTSQG